MKKSRIICNLLIVIIATIGIYLNLNEPNVAKNIILYFTTQSNIWILLICLIMVLYDTLKKEIPKTIYVIKYIFTISIIITGLVYNFVLAPQYGSILKTYSMSMTILHVVVPILSLISYLYFDKDVFKKKFNLLGIIMPLLYFIFMIILSFSDNYYFDISGTEAKFPYFFLDYINNGWFTITSDITKLGTFYWIIIIIIVIIIISQILRKTKRKILKKSFDKK